MKTDILRKKKPYNCDLCEKMSSLNCAHTDESHHLPISDADEDTKFYYQPLSIDFFMDLLNGGRTRHL